MWKYLPLTMLCTTVISVQADDAAIIQDIQSKLETADHKTILSVEGETKVSDQVIYVDTLRFDDGATLALEAADRDAVYLIAKEIRLSSPKYKATIKYFDREPPKSANGAAPPAKPGKASRSRGNGAAGANGIAGKPGEAGKTRELPTLYIVTNEISYQRAMGDPAGYQDIRIRVDGIDGGTGGNGGNGQDGQDGQDGRHGEANAGICSRGPRSGGNGGAGGAFGKGGIGGDGGDGGDVVFVVTSDAVDDIKDIRITNRGGLPGLGGLHGQPGKGGSGGSRGSRPGTCSGGSPGSGGSTPTAPEPNARAAAGQNEGSAGTVRYVEFRGIP